jgi:hypothetical protein
VRKGASLLVAALAIVSPASATAFSGTYTGDVAGDTSPDYSLTFTARAHFAGPHQTGKLVPTKVRDFVATVQFSCFDAMGTQISSARRGDLAPGFFKGLKVGRKGRFGGTAPTATGLTYTTAGRLGRGNQGWGNGVLQVVQGQRGSDGYCTTGTFADPTIRWRARFLPNRLLP